MRKLRKAPTMTQDKIMKATKYMRKNGIPIINNGNAMRHINPREVKAGDFISTSNLAKRKHHGSGEQRLWEVLSVNKKNHKLKVATGISFSPSTIINIDYVTAAMRIMKPWWEVLQDQEEQRDRNKQWLADRRAGLLGSKHKHG